MFLSGLFLFIYSAILLQCSSATSCQTMDVSTMTLKLGTVCKDVVDYPFLLPTGVTAAHLNDMAVSKLNETKLAILPTACLVALKKMVCTSIYLKCHPTAVLTNVATWNFNIYSDISVNYPLPFQRPCKKLCDDVSHSCFGLLKLLSLAPNCTAVYDYSNGAITAGKPHQFDATNNALTCNIASAPVQISSTREVYLFQQKGACAGILDEIWVPPGNLVSSLLSPLQPPYQVQIAIESQLQSNFANIPSSLTECRFAMRKHYCASYFLRPQYKSIKNVFAENSFGAAQIAALQTYGGLNASFLQYAFYLPSYPHKDICLNYQSKCGVLLSILGDPSLTPHCNSISNITHMPNYPTVNQSIQELTLTIPNIGSSTLEFVTAPNRLVTAVDNNAVQTVSQAGVCTTLTFASPTLALSSVCSDVVDYPYYRPYGMSDSYLNNMALSKLNNSKIDILPVDCKVALKKLVCASVYLKCKPNINLNNQASWNYDIYKDYSIPYPMPFQRPCASLCTAVQPRCLGLLSLFKLSIDCSAKFDYSGGMISAFLPYQFDSSNDLNKCNAATANITVGGTKEPYLYSNGGGACSGIVKEVFIPPASKIKGINLAPLQKPFVIQNLIETQLAKSFKALPVWLSPECRFALKKYHCSSNLLAPQAQNMGKVLQSSGVGAPQLALLGSLGVDTVNLAKYTFYLPSYPSQQVCTNYESQCMAFIAAAKVSNPAIEPQCSAVDSEQNTKKYPSANQTISTLSLTVPVGGGATATLNLKFDTAPASYAAVHDTSGYTVSCPPGFVIPDDPTDKDVVWITGSGCAMSCYRSAIWSTEEWKYFEGITQVVSIVGLISILTLLALWLSDKERRKQYLVICFAFLSLLATISIVASSYRKEHSKFCRNNAVGYNADDGLNFCSVQSVMLTYSGLGCCLAWLMISVELFNKVVRMRSTKGHYKVTVPIIFGLPLASVAYLLGSKHYGYIGSLPWCFTAATAPDNSSLVFFYFPVLILTIIGVVLMGITIATIIRVTTKASSTSTTTIASTSNNHTTIITAGSDDNYVTKQYKRFVVVKSPLVFVVVCLICWVTMFGFKGTTMQHGAHVKSSFKEWAACVFSHYDGSGTNESYKDVCGTRASFHYNIITIGWVMFCVSGQSIFVSFIYLPTLLTKYFRICGIRISNVTSQYHSIHSQSDQGSPEKHNNSTYFNTTSNANNTIGNNNNNNIPGSKNSSSRVSSVVMHAKLNQIVPTDESFDNNNNSNSPVSPTEETALNPNYDNNNNNSNSNNNISSPAQKHHVVNNYFSKNDDDEDGIQLAPLPSSNNNSVKEVGHALKGKQKNENSVEYIL